MLGISVLVAQISTTWGLNDHGHPSDVNQIEKSHPGYRCTSYCQGEQGQEQAKHSKGSWCRDRPGNCPQGEVKKIRKL